MLHILLSAAINAFELKDYQGGSNPLLIWLGGFLLLGVSLFLVGSFIYDRWKKMNFFTECEKLNLSKEEAGSVASLAKRINEKEPLSVLLDIKRFDHFVNRVANYYRTNSPSKKALKDKASFFELLRDTLGFHHRLTEAKLTSSRSLPMNMPITIHYLDPKTKQKISFHTKIKFYNEFFLYVDPPKSEDATDHALLQPAKNFVTLSFVRENDAEYSFDSKLLFQVDDEDEKIWVLEHSQKLIKGEKAPKTCMDAKVAVISQQSGNQELSISLRQLTKQEGYFEAKDMDLAIETPSSGLLSFHYNGKEEVVPIRLTAPFKRKDKNFYRFMFKSKKKEDMEIIFEIVNKIQAAAK